MSKKMSQKDLRNLQVRMAQNFPPNTFECVKKS